MINFNALLVTIITSDGVQVDTVVEVTRMIDIEDLALQLTEQEISGEIKKFNINRIQISNVQNYTQNDD